MKLSELSKSELCELIVSLRGKTSFLTQHKIAEFLRKRWERKNEELLAELDRVNIMDDFANFKKINKELDKLHNNANYYLHLDELREKE